MKCKIFLYFIFFFCLAQLQAQESGKNGQNESRLRPNINNVMSEAYWKIWNPEVQAKIDRDIEQNRKADAICELKGVSRGMKVKVEQISHDFIFGAHIFNFNQLGTEERNRKYKELFGTLFNSATISFYWKKFEMQPNRPRFREEYWDTEAYWNSVKEPKKEPHWRRPATDPVVEFCNSKGIRAHGHTIIWSNPKWHIPEWIFEQYCPVNEKEKLNKLSQEELKKLSLSEINELAPVYFKEMARLFEKRLAEIANYYGDRIPSWDVVNESAIDYHGNCLTGDAVCKTLYHGLMPGDYTYHAFKLADQVFPKSVKLNINDYCSTENYPKQIHDLQAHGCRIDIMGSQMHLFNPKQCLDIADGKPIETPQAIWDQMKTIEAGIPIHKSEITITSPGGDERGCAIQAVIARNLYRLWFSIKPMMGITWWNVVDDCGAPGEPSVSGLFTRNMEPKLSFHALDQLINHEWKTNMTINADENGNIKFRGFKGLYRLSWKDKSGKEQKTEFYLKKDGDGL